eukprot:6478976-Amphidinium_carterae.2
MTFKEMLQETRQFWDSVAYNARQGVLRLHARMCAPLAFGDAWGEGKQQTVLCSWLIQGEEPSAGATFRKCMGKTKNILDNVSCFVVHFQFQHCPILIGVAHGKHFWVHRHVLVSATTACTCIRSYLANALFLGGY